jgi:FlaA1/EpsC-like NDP-sugar epimerase
LQRRLDEYAESVEFVLGDVRNTERVGAMVAGVDVVFHAAAVKHVGLSEGNPFEAVQTNVQGTQNLVRAAIAEGVESFTAISTDKASNPNSVMGATKLLMERLVVAANADDTQTDTRFNCVRFGNVLGSTGSVVPVFLDQIEAGGPITVTNPDMTRFIMSVDRAVNLVLDAHDRMTLGEVVVLKMPAFRVGDLAEALRTEYASEFGYAPSDIDIEVVGKRPGERVHEKLVSHDEVDNVYDDEDEETFVILPEISFDDAAHECVADNSLDGEYTSADAELLPPSELAAMVRGRQPTSSSAEAESRPADPLKQ